MRGAAVCGLGDPDGEAGEAAEGEAVPAVVGAGAAERAAAGRGPCAGAEQPLRVSTARAAAPPPDSTTVRSTRMAPRFPPGVHRARATDARTSPTAVRRRVGEIGAG
ncbi:hypothetical protein, partial [Actinacidiphila rubida]|uniref:hypothetical protein n=1 Tax=Actinacidiphila rubida TaxID=310780 RepID=UPI00396A106B